MTPDPGHQSQPRMPVAARWALSGAIVAFWLAMMATLFWRELWPQRRLGGETLVAPEELKERWRDIDECMELFYKGRALGIVRTQALRQPGGEYLAASRLRAVLPLGVLRPAIQADGVALLDGEFTLVSAALDARFAGAALRGEALVQGDALYYLVGPGASGQGGRVQGARLMLQSPPSFLQTMRSLLARRYELQVGQVYVVPAFDSLWNFGDGMATVRVVAREPVPPRPDPARVEGRRAEAFKLEMIINGVRSYAWVDDGGQTVRQEFGKDLVFERCAPAEAERRFPELAAPLAPPRIDRDAIVAAANQTTRAPGAAPLSMDEGVLGLLLGALGGE